MTLEHLARTIAKAHTGSDAYWGNFMKAAEAVEAMNGWQPIETAPKDMTEVIVLCGPKDVRLGWYFAPSSTTRGWRDQRQKPIIPTHWMPLPTPPTLR